MNRLQQLYDSEINWTISTHWDLGFCANVFDEQGRSLMKDKPTWNRTLVEAEEALWNAAKKYYPKATCFREEKK